MKFVIRNFDIRNLVPVPYNSNKNSTNATTFVYENNALLFYLSLFQGKKIFIA
jgi:hypothetical protein